MQIPPILSAYVDSSGKSGNTLPRLLKKVALRLRIWFHRNANGVERTPRPTAVGPEVAAAQRIWAEVVHRPDSELLYNPVNGEAYAVLEGAHPLYIFLEKERFRIVNSVVGYDVALSLQSELWATQLFNREVHRRRSLLKEAALHRVMASLQHLEERLLHEREHSTSTLHTL